jgi:hypothetical protein
MSQTRARKKVSIPVEWQVEIAESSVDSGRLVDEEQPDWRRSSGKFGATLGNRYRDGSQI